MPDADPWETVSEDFRGVLHSLKEAYRGASNGDGPSEEEIREAFGTLLGAWDKVAEAVSAALAKPEVRERLKETAGSLATALGATITDLGEELRSAGTSGNTEEQ